MRVLGLLSILVTAGPVFAQDTDSGSASEEASNTAASGAYEDEDLLSKDNRDSSSEQDATEAGSEEPRSPLEASPGVDVATEQVAPEATSSAPSSDIYTQDVLSSEEEEAEEPIISSDQGESTSSPTADEPVSEKDLRVFSPSLNAHEMPESAHTVGAGNYQVHLGLGQSSFGLSDSVDLRTRVVGQFFGFNAQLKWAITQEESQALSLEPGVWAEWPWAKMGFPSYSVGTMLRHTQRVSDKARLHMGVGAYYDVLKVTLQFSDDYVAGQGFGGDWYYSLTMTRAPLVFGHEVEDISNGDSNPGWKFTGIRVPVVFGYEYLTSDRSSFNTVLRFHPMNYSNGGGWYAEVHPTYVTRMGDHARIALGVNLVMPGNPLPIADEALSDRVEEEQSNLHIRGWEDWFPKLAVAPIPYLGVYWVF